MKRPDFTRATRTRRACGSVAALTALALLSQEAAQAAGASAHYAVPAAAEDAGGRPGASSHYSQQSQIGALAGQGVAGGEMLVAGFLPQIDDGNTPPSLVLPTAPVLADATSAEGALVSFSVEAADFEQGALQPVVTPPSGSLFPIGDTTVQATVTDADGETATGSFIVRVQRPATVLARGEAVPGAAQPGDEIPSGGIPAGATWSVYSVPTLVDDGRLVMRAVLRVGSVYVPSVVVGDRSFIAIAKKGDAVPGVAGARFSDFRDPLAATDANGKLTVVFLASILGENATKSDGQVLCSYSEASGQGLQLLARQKMTLDETGAKLDAFVSAALSKTGRAMFVATLVNGSGNVTSASNLALYAQDSSGALKRTLRTGDEFAGEGGPRKVLRFATLSNAIGSLGQGRFVNDVNGDVVARVSFADNSSGIYACNADTGITEAIRSGAGFAALPGAKFAGFDTPSINDAGGVAGLATLDGDGVALPNNTVLFEQPEGLNTRLVAREGGVAPDTAGLVFSGFKDPVYNNEGRLAFVAYLTGAPASTNQALYERAAPEAPLHIVARKGFAAPDGGGILSSFLSIALPDGPNAAPVFVATLLPGPGGITSANNLGLWAADGDRPPRLIVRKGDKLLANGIEKTVKIITVLSAVTKSSGQARSYNNAQGLVYRASFTDGTQAIVKVKLF